MAAWHVAPTIREMEVAKIAAGLIQSYSSTGYTERAAQEGVSQPTPHGSWAQYFYFGGSRQTPTL